jgi:DNA polymerase-3 subunit gamma/tau
VADLPPPGDLVRRLTDANAAPSAPVPLPPGNGGGARAVANGAPIQMAQPAALPADAPRLSGWRDVTALVAARREALLHSHLLHSVHLVRFAPPVIEIRQQPEAPRDLAARLAAVLQEATGTRWTIALSTTAGAPTLAEQGVEADGARRQAAAVHPLVRAILDAFPGAVIESVHDPRTDAYGLPLELETPLAGEPDRSASTDPDMPEFAPPDAEFASGPSNYDPSEYWETTP